MAAQVVNDPETGFVLRVTLGELLTIGSILGSAFVLWGKLAIVGDHVEILWKWAGFGS